MNFSSSQLVTKSARQSSAILGATRESRESFLCFYASGGKLFHRDSVGPCGRCGEGGIEIENEARIEFQVIFEDLDHANLVIAFKVDLAEIVLDEEVIGDSQPFAVVCESDGLRSGIQPQVDDSCPEPCFRVAGGEHAHLPCLERGVEQAVATLRHSERSQQRTCNRCFVPLHMASGTAQWGKPISCSLRCLTRVSAPGVSLQERPICLRV